jgi:hypothetical protein
VGAVRVRKSDIVHLYLFSQNVRMLSSDQIFGAMLPVSPSQGLLHVRGGFPAISPRHPGRPPGVGGGVGSWSPVDS